MAINNGRFLRLNFQFGPHGSAVATLDPTNEDYHLDISPDLLAGCYLSILDQLADLDVEPVAAWECSPETLPSGGLRVWLAEIDPSDYSDAPPATEDGWGWADVDEFDMLEVPAA